MRMCIDYRALNKVTIKNSSPLPRIDECLDRLQGASWFTTLDLKSGYHQIKIKESDVPKTAFNTRYGKFHWCVLPMGLSNSPPTFQAWMNELLGDCLDKYALVYLDDVCIFSKNEEEHKEHVKAVLDRLKNANLVVNSSKCHFAQRKLVFLGYEISSSGISPSSDKVEAVSNWPKPENVQQVRQFLGLSQHYRRFIPGFSTVAAPLTDLTKGVGPKKRDINWTDDCDASFKKVKGLLTSAPVLQMPDMNLPYIIETDSSEYGVGAVLLQPASEHRQATNKNPYGTLASWHPVAFESKKLSAAEQKLPAQERELLGIVYALRTWRCYIDGCPAGYTVYSDHNPLVYFRTQVKPTSRLVRWISELEMFAPEIKYKPGKENMVADALSRIGDETTPAADSMEPQYLFTAWSDLPEELKSDWPLLYTNGGDNKVSSSDLKALLKKEKQNFSIKDGHIFRLVKPKDNSSEKEVPFVPFVQRADLVANFHNGFGHASEKNMVHLMCSRYWWPHMRRDIKQWIAPCPACQINGKKINRSQEVMHPLDIPPGAFERWHLDFVGELPTTINGNKWLITAVDYTTNWPIAKALPAATKEAVAQFIYEEIVTKFGCPVEILTDRGANFTSGLVEEYLKLIGTKHKLTSAFHPRTNSKVERYNGTIKQMLRKYVQGGIHRWDEFVDVALWSSRIWVSSTTGYSPYYLVYGRQPKLPGDSTAPFISREALKDPRTMAEITANELTDLGQHRGAAQARMKAVSDKDKERWDFHIEPTHYDVGDLVLLTHEGRFGLEPRFKGPYIITQVFAEYGTYELETMAGQKLDTLVHKDRLKAAKGEKPVDSWYDPTASRRVVKSATSSRSGRGGGSSSITGCLQKQVSGSSGVYIRPPTTVTFDIPEDKGDQQSDKNPVIDTDQGMETASSLGNRTSSPSIEDMEDVELMRLVNKQDDFIDEQAVDNDIEEAKEEYHNDDKYMFENQSERDTMSSLDNEATNMPRSSSSNSSSSEGIVADQFKVNTTPELIVEEVISLPSSPDIALLPSSPIQVDDEEDIAGYQSDGFVSCEEDDNEEQAQEVHLEEEGQVVKEAQVDIVDLTRDTSSEEDTVTVMREPELVKNRVEVEEQAEGSGVKDTQEVQGSIKVEGTGVERQSANKKIYVEETEFKNFMFDHDIKAVNSFVNTPIARPTAYANDSDVERPTSVREMGDVGSDIPDVPPAILNWNKNKRVSFKPRVPIRKKQRINFLRNLNSLV